MTDDLFAKISKEHEKEKSFKTVDSWFNEKLKSMEEWLAVRVDMDSDKQCTITIEK